MSYSELTVPQLKDEVSRRGLQVQPLPLRRPSVSKPRHLSNILKQFDSQVSSKAKKSEFIAALEDADKADPAHASAATSHDAPTSPLAPALGSKRSAEDRDDAKLHAPVKKEKSADHEGHVAQVKSEDNMEMTAPVYVKRAQPQADVDIKREALDSAPKAEQVSSFEDEWQVNAAVSSPSTVSPARPPLADL
jgi:hypothetical protein